MVSLTGDLGQRSKVTSSARPSEDLEGSERPIAMQNEGFAAGVQKGAGRLEGPPGAQEARGCKVSPAQCLLVPDLQLTGNRQMCLASFSSLL